MPEPRCVVPAGDWTGEGALWHAGERAVYWVDINRFLIHRFDPATTAVRTWFFTEPPAAIGLTDRSDTLIVANGFSCQEQVEQLGGKRPLHLAEVLAMAIGESPSRLKAAARRPRSRRG